ncbi:alpha/beta fold hydrolase [Actinophytocola oryzae]|uniref:Pimeloyl-ACP methyl ester carboxylesterase n=1 Tax=Actinophytocola oryzae TaxID=502181 RepID=A0A4R7VYF1_9PSEU|nr:alpha/beta fold hydrolase [Actinophytocola oryzae]TDV55094.1 pimeloyl-ACP methyl ester carboxylesterase [Actinophytocola oryzae]
MSFAHAADGTSLYYEVDGHGDDVLVLIAGQSNNHHWWDVAREDFAAHFRTVVFDHRGTGRSDKPESGYDTRVFATDVVAILDDLGVDQAHVYGTSMGGRAAQWLAADHPSRVRRLVLGCTSPGARHGVERSAELRRALAQRDRDAAQRVLLELMYTPDWLATHPGPFHTIGDPDMPQHARRGHFLASRNHDGWDACAKIVAPALVLHGADDVFNPAANAPLLADRIPDAHAVLIPHARHAYFEEFRSVASPTVVNFLTVP